MRTIEEIRHARLLQLLAEPRFKTIQAFADTIERSHAQVSQWKNRNVRKNKGGEVTGLSNIDSASARWIEEQTGKERGWMDNDPEQVDADLPPRPTRDYKDRLEVSRSDWALLQDVRDGASEEELAAIRAKAKGIRAKVDALLEERLRQAKDDAS